MADNKPENTSKGYKQIFDDANPATSQSCQKWATGEIRRLMQRTITLLTLTLLLFGVGCSDQAQQQRLSQSSNQIRALKINLANTQTDLSNEIVALRTQLAHTETVSSNEFEALATESEKELAAMQVKISKAEKRAKDAEEKLVAEREQMREQMRAFAERELAEREQMRVTAEREKELALSAAIPELPIKFTQRKAGLLGSGFVYTFRNNGDSTLPIKVHIMNPTVGKTHAANLTINAGTFKEIGHLEGWSGNKGDVIEVTSAGFKPQLIKI